MSIISPRRTARGPLYRTPHTARQFRTSKTLVGLPKLRGSLSLIDKEMTQQQFYDEIEYSLNQNLRRCIDSWQEFQVYRTIFARIADRYGFLGGISKVKNGYDQLIDRLSDECQVASNDLMKSEIALSKVDLQIQEKQNKIDKKREKYDTLENSLNFSINDIKTEYDNLQNQLLSLQQECRDTQRSIKERALLSLELSDREKKEKKCYENAKLIKEQLLAELDCQNSLQSGAKKDLENFLGHVYENTNKLTCKNNEMNKLREEHQLAKKEFQDLEKEYFLTVNKEKELNNEIDKKKLLIEQQQKMIKILQELISSN